MTAACALGALLVGLPAVVPSSDAADDFPSWDEIQAAQGDAARAAAEVDRIDAALSALETTAAQLGDAAVAAGADYSSAEAALDDAEASFATLSRNAAAAAERAEASRRRAGATASSLARAGNPTGELLLSGDSGNELLYRLGALSRLGASTDAALAVAEVDRKQSRALAAQAEEAKAVRDRLASTARTRLDAATSAQAAADAQVAELEQQSATLYAQLAVLKQTSADVEERYRQGVAAQQSVVQQAPPATEEDAGPADAVSAVSSGDGSLSPADAQSYAADQLPSWGWDGSQLQCLVSLWNRESGWRWNAYNSSSGAYGIPQSLPGSKMGSAGADWRTSSATQIQWGLGYIRSVYGSPCGAWSHSQSTGWY